MNAFNIIIALLFPLLSIFGFIFSCAVFFRFDKVKSWINKRAEKDIVSSFSFRTLRTLIITLVSGYVLMMAGVIISLSIWGETATDTSIFWSCSIFAALALAYPVWRLVRRIRQYKDSNDKKAVKWMIIYDLLMNFAALFGGFLLIIVMAFAAVILSFTKWSGFIPGRLRELSGVEVVPESNKYYIVGAVLGLVAVVSQWIGEGGQTFIAWMVGLSAVAIILYAFFQIRNTPKESRKQISWQWGYMILTTYAVFTITWILIFIALILLVLYIILAATGHAGNGKDSYKVTCDNLTDDVINGRGICSITNSRCKARDSGSCPYK